MSIRITPAAAVNKPSGKLYLSVDQLNLVDAVWTVVELDAISAGFTDGIENTGTHRITPGVAGLYCVIGKISLSSVVADRGYMIALRLNGVTYKSVALLQASIAYTLGIPVSVHTYMSATDYVELLVRSRALVDTVDLVGAEHHTYMSLQRVR